MWKTFLFCSCPVSTLSISKNCLSLLRRPTKDQAYDRTCMSSLTKYSKIEKRITVERVNKQKLVCDKIYKVASAKFDIVPCPIPFPMVWIIDQKFWNYFWQSKAFLREGLYVSGMILIASMLNRGWEPRIVEIIFDFYKLHVIFSWLNWKNAM